MNKNLIIAILMLLGFALFYSELLDLFVSMTGPILNSIGVAGISIIVAVITFFYSYKNSVKLFEWIEDQTYGTRDYILGKCELLFIEVEPIKITYILLFLTFGMSILTVGFFSIMGMFTVGLVFGVIVGIIGWKLPKPIINFMVTLRIKKFEDQIVDGLSLLANGMRAGRGLQQAMNMVVEELPAPISQEFNLILQQTKIGVPINEAFDNFAKRMPTEDNNMFVSAINILKETGGNLAETFDTIVEIVRERIRLKQKIGTYVAQGFQQAMIMFSMPFMMALFFGNSDPTFFDKLFGTPIGIVFMLIALVLDFIGLYFILKIINIKV
jgi:tight adherence protein B